MSFLKRSVLALRTLFSVLLASLVVFALITGWGVYYERSRILDAAHEDVQQAVNQNAAALSAALWNYDSVGLTALLQGIVRVDAITRIVVRDDQGVVADVSRPENARAQAASTVSRRSTTPILSPDGGKRIGTLEVSESYAELESSIGQALGTLVMTELAKIVGLTAVLFVIVYRQIARHLGKLAEDVAVIAPGDLDAKVGLDRQTPKYRDELDTLVESINGFLQGRAVEMRKRAAVEAHLGQRMAETEAVLGALTDGVIALDRHCHVRHANGAAMALLGRAGETIEGGTLDGLLTVIDERSGRALDGLCQSVAQGGEPLHLRGHVRIRCRDGKEFDARISAVPVPGSGDVAMIFVFTDISAEINSERKIEFQAFHDPLTELGNRSLLTRDLTAEIERAGRLDQRIAVLCVDLDNFKNINDTLGHAVGDAMLQKLADRFRSVVQAPAWVTRHGGDEFVIVVPQLVSAEQASAMASTLMRHIAEPFALEGNDLRVTSSVGISLYPDHGRSIGELVSNADLAMYEAKREGRNTYRFYELGLLYRSSARLAMENGLRVALAERQFSLVFQPKLHLDDRRVDAVEALLRWKNSQGESISPTAFIPVAEECGLIIDIGDWVLRESLDAARRLREKLGYPVAVAANVSAVQFRSERLLDTLNELAKAEPALGELIEIELTESALAGNIAEVRAKLDSIRALGLKIAIDDFGTGYSSLAYLKTFPINILKIDRAFISDLHVNAQDRAIVGSVVQLGKSLGFSIVAEGVEEAAQVQILTDLACDYVQGFWFARPMPEADVVELLRLPRA